MRWEFHVGMCNQCQITYKIRENFWEKMYATCKFYWFPSDTNDLYLWFNFTNIYKLTCVSYEILSCIFSGIFVKTFAENVERETREYYSLICSDDLNMVKQTSRKCMCVVYSIWRNSSNGRINPECIMFCNFRLFKYHMCARQIYNIFMQFFQR